MSQQWSDTALVNEYTTSNENPLKSWYENEVNIPSILSLIPKGSVRILDFGCGPGSLTGKLAQTYEPEGADSSEGMLKTAREHNPSLDFFAWDGLGPLPTDRTKYNVIVTKLTLEFTEDLTTIAKKPTGRASAWWLTDIFSHASYVGPSRQSRR